jgi:hypothetical protein
MRTIDLALVAIMYTDSETASGYCPALQRSSPVGSFPIHGQRAAFRRSQSFALLIVSQRVAQRKTRPPTLVVDGRIGLVKSRRTYILMKRA